MGAMLVAKKKSIAPPLAPASLGPKPTALTIKGSPEWRDWVDGGAEHCRTDVAKLVDAALVEYLRARGYTTEPPRR